ncbi:MAG: polysulfide reductase NrfD [Chloroflexi bacterium]|nr:polysulfide reductase NrfD [Chloroflexota bacterium]
MPTNLQIPEWQWWIIFYFFFGGIAGGAYFTSTMIELVGGPEDRPIARMGYYIAFPLSLVCAICLIFDLGQPSRFWHMIVYSITLTPIPKWDSAISVGSYALLFFSLFSFLSFVDALIETGRLPWAPLREKYSGTPRLIYSVIGALFGFFLASYTGVLLATTQLPAWANNPLLGALFLASGASTGMAAVTLGLVLTQTDIGAAWAKLKQADNAAMILEIILLIAFVALLGAAASYFLTGLSGILLIGGTLILGLIVPLALQFKAGFQGAKMAANMTMLVAVLILAGGFIFRVVVVMGAQGLL